MKKLSIACFVLLFTLLLACSPKQEAQENEPPPSPNLVLIIADDMGWNDAGAYGHPHIKTPHLDQLAREGMRFDNAFLTTSSCSPSRSSIITGRYPHNTDAEQLHWPLPAAQVTFVEKLKEAGYYTAAAGKWHLGDAVKDRFDLIVGGDPAALPLYGETEKMEGEDDGSGCAAWIPVLQQRPEDRPFFLWLAAIDPHRDYKEGIIPEPHQPEDAVVPPYLPDTPEVREDLALYYDEISRMDSYIGQVMEELEKQGVAENTMVLFISDNGRPFPRAKTTLHDSGIKTPWIVRWPAQVEAGATSNQLVSSVDIATTMLGLAGVSAGSTFEGKDFSPLLSDPTQQIREYVYAEAHWHDYEKLTRAVRSPHFKYIRNFLPEYAKTPPADAVGSPTFQTMRQLRDAGELTEAQRVVFNKPSPEEELYDTEADPFELKNLADDPDYTGQLEQLRQELISFQERTGDSLPSFRTPDEFDREEGTRLPNWKMPRTSKEEFMSGSGE